jgi:type IV secretion system protein TrbL
MNTGVIDQFLNTFTTYIDSGFGLLGGEVAFLATTLTTIDVTIAVLFWAWSAGEDLMVNLIKKTLYVGFFAFLIGNFNGLAKIIFNSFSGLGLKAAGSTMTADQLLQPGRIAQVGIDAGRPILQAANSVLGFTAIFSPTSWVEVIVLLIAWLIVVGSFFVLAIQLFVALIEFKLTTLAGFVLVPFGLFGKTAFLAERVLGNVMASGVKILVLAIILGIGTSLFSQFTQGFGGNQPTLDSVLPIALAALTLLGLGIYGPGIATGLAAGAPQLGGGAATGTVAVVRDAATAGWSATNRAAAGGLRLAASSGRLASSASVGFGRPFGGDGGGPAGGGPGGGPHGGDGGGGPAGGGPGGGGSRPPVWAHRLSLLRQARRSDAMRPRINLRRAQGR